MVVINDLRWASLIIVTIKNPYLLLKKSEANKTWVIHVWNIMIHTWPDVQNKKRTEGWYDCLHPLTQEFRHITVPQSDDAITHTHTLYQHTAGHANTCIVLIKGWCIPAGSVRVRVWKPANQLSPEVISKKLKSVIWTDQWSKWLCVLERAMLGSFYERDMATGSSQQSARRADGQRATHRLRNDKKQREKKQSFNQIRKRRKG